MSMRSRFLLSGCNHLGTLLFPGTQGHAKWVWQRPQWELIFAKVQSKREKLYMDIWRPSQLVPHP